MKWHSESHGDYVDRLMKWHKWFAWFPVFCYPTRKTIWLEFVSRRVDNYSAYLEEFDFEYKEIL